MAGPSPQAKGGLNVLIDGHYRDQATGTGISTYSRQLAAALSRLGHRTSWLHGRPSRPATNPDHPPGLAERLAGAPQRWAHTLIGPTLRPQQLDGDAWNVPNLYTLAHHRHSWAGLFTGVSPPPGVDMLHLSAPLPIAMRVPTVLTIHDLIPLRLPDTTPDNRSEMLRRLRTGARLATRIVTVSEASKADICNDLGVAPEKVVVTYQSADIVPLTDSERTHTPDVLQRHGLKPQRYILFVGAIEPKKNLRRLIEAFLAIDTDIPLVVAGRKAWLWEKEITLAQGPAAKGRIRFLDYVPQADLPHLYAGALFLAFPSLYEGFGLPPLEAMLSGCPVLTSNVASLPEICGDAALYVDPMSSADIRDKLTRLLGDDDLRSRLSQAGLIQAQKFSAAAYAERLKQVYPT